ncbi:MAG: DM13 domain-containing protein [Actinomycetota bacterium]|nr:DM13 domain-containing protein [Actinomycetota bacterium]
MIALLATAAAAAAGCGGEDASERSDPFTAVERNERANTKRVQAEAAPRWERVTTLRGSGDSTETIRIESGAVQWRVRWRCSKGSFKVSQEPAPDEGNPIGVGRCPGEGDAEAIDTGEIELSVQTEGRWRAVIEQQVTDPVAEPPLPAMKAEDAEVLAKGRFYDIERRGDGTAVLHELPNGRLALRLEGFSTSNNTDLFVWLSEAARPRTTKQALRSQHTEFALLKATIGDQNYLLPKDADPEEIRSIVIWCEPIRIAYTAASLD